MRGYSSFTMEESRPPKRVAPSVQNSAQGSAPKRVAPPVRIAPPVSGPSMDGVSHQRSACEAFHDSGPTLTEILEETTSQLEDALKINMSDGDDGDVLPAPAGVPSLLARPPAPYVDADAAAYCKRILQMLAAENVGPVIPPLAATVLERQVKSLHIVTCQGYEGAPIEEVRNLLIRNSEGDKLPRASLETIPQRLNPSQRQAVTSAVLCRSTLIWGSPGTGKTSVAVEILRHWSDADAALLSSHCYHNLATSDTNVNVDNMAARVSEIGLCVRRIGRAKAVRPSNRCLMLGLPAEQRRQFREAQVVACTAMGVGRHLFDGMTFARVLVDEAAQISEPSVLVPLARGCRQLAQMGDFKQLPPTVTQEKALATGLGESLFERLYYSQPSITLSVQYRMHPFIARFPRMHFYATSAIEDFQDEDSTHAIWLHVTTRAWVVQAGLVGSWLAAWSTDRPPQGKPSMSNFFLLLERMYPRHTSGIQENPSWPNSGIPEKAFPAYKKS